jgi:hypothetical protein
MDILQIGNFWRVQEKMFNIYLAWYLYITVGHIRGTKLGNVNISNFSNSRKILIFRNFLTQKFRFEIFVEWD